MSPGLRLAAAWALIACGATLVVTFAVVAVRFRAEYGSPEPYAPTIGAGLLVAGWYLRRRARAEIRWRAAARRDSAPRGFEVVRPASATAKRREK